MDIEKKVKEITFNNKIDYDTFELQFPDKEMLKKALRYCLEQKIEFTFNYQDLVSLTPEINPKYDSPYIREIRQKPLLTFEEEQKYSKLVKEGNEEAKRIMCESNLRLVAHMARRYVGHGLSYLDLIQEGNLGLIKAVEEYDPSFGYKFSTYATWWIKSAMTRAIANYSRTIRISVHANERGLKISKFEEDYYKKNGRYPSISEISKSLNISENTIEIIKKGNIVPASLNQPILSNDNSSDELADFVKSDLEPVEDEFIRKDNNEYIRDIVFDSNLLSRNEKRVIYMRYIFDEVNECRNIENELFNEEEIKIIHSHMSDENRTLEEISKIFGVTRERIRQIEAKALRKLRIYLERENKYDGTGIDIGISRVRKY